MPKGLQGPQCSAVMCSNLEGTWVCQGVRQHQGTVLSQDTWRRYCTSLMRRVYGVPRTIHICCNHGSRWHPIVLTDCQRVVLWCHHPNLSPRSKCRIESRSRFAALAVCSRRLITMRKDQLYCAAEAAAYHKAAGDPLMAIDTVHDTVYEQRAEKVPRVPGESRKKVPKSANRRFRSKVV